MAASACACMTQTLQYFLSGKNVFGTERGRPMRGMFQLRGCAAVLAAGLVFAGACPALTAQAATIQTAQDSGMTLDTSELTLELADGESLPVAYLDVQAHNDYFFLIWSSSNPSVASVDGTGKVTGR